MSQLLEKFIASFKKAIAEEMAAMRQRLGPFEVELTNGRFIEKKSDGLQLHTFDIVTPNDKLILHSECTFNGGDVEFLVTVVGLTNNSVTLEGEHLLPCSATDARLVIYPWFLYERLQETLTQLNEVSHYNIKAALRLFGKKEPIMDKGVRAAEVASLNSGQNEAITLCAKSNLAFVWGPPGTGKTTTLAHVVLDQLKRRQRILVTSTTNAAVDQVIAKLNSLDEGKTLLNDGSIVRVGHTDSPTYGAALRDVAKRRDEKNQKRLEHLLRQRPIFERKCKSCQELLSQLEKAAGPRQLSLFGPPTADTLSARELSTVFGRDKTKTLLSSTEERQKQTITLRKKRLEAALELSLEKIRESRAALRNQEELAIGHGRVVLATMTNMYINKLLRKERFDVVIVEEAGMAILPTLFYCSSLAKKKTIMIGDPRQLPPIVQSSADYVRKAMGRSIFEVTVPNPHDSEIVAMLATQYRMHPVIGQLVSNLFYDGRLENGDCTKERQKVADCPPYPKEPLILVDTRGIGTCQTRHGAYSRFNEETAKLCVELARQAIAGGLSSVAIIAPYAEHVRLMNRLLTQSLPKETREKIECRTVHRFQGNERDLVIFDTVDTIPMKPGILLSDKGPGSSARNLVNVSISRARGKLILVSDAAYFQARAPKSIIDELTSLVSEKGCLQTEV